MTWSGAIISATPGTRLEAGDMVGMRDGDEDRARDSLLLPLPRLRKSRAFVRGRAGGSFAVGGVERFGDGGGGGERAISIAGGRKVDVEDEDEGGEGRESEMREGVRVRA